mmetsp:Transcript_42633/g.109685  ORF Transcript_42633/g.109685 Transcript_42633/m.109685 type:complete len:412 (+) Transcript_42633:8315-9550(+)
MAQLGCALEPGEGLFHVLLYPSSFFPAESILVHGRGVFCLCSSLQQFHFPLQVDLHAFASFVTQGQLETGLRVPFFGGFAQEFDRFLFVFFCAFPLLIALGEANERVEISQVHRILIKRNHHTQIDSTHSNSILVALDQSMQRLHMSCLGSIVIQIDGLQHISRHNVAFVEILRELERGVRFSSITGLSIQFHGSFDILFHLVPLHVAAGEDQKRGRVFMFLCGFVIPKHGLFVILNHSLSFFITLPKCKHGTGAFPASDGCLLKQVNGLFLVFQHNTGLPRLEIETQLIQGRGVTGAGSFLKPFQSCLRVLVHALSFLTGHSPKIHRLYMIFFSSLQVPYCGFLGIHATSPSQCVLTSTVEPLFSVFFFGIRNFCLTHSCTGFFAFFPHNQLKQEDETRSTFQQSEMTAC